MQQCLQAAVAAATATVLRNHVASPAVLADNAMNLPGRDPQQVVTDCVHALCQWRDDVARDKDEGWYCSRHLHEHSAVSTFTLLVIPVIL